MTEEQRAFRVLAALFRLAALLTVFAAGTVYRFTQFQDIAFYLLCAALTFIIYDNNCLGMARKRD